MFVSDLKFFLFLCLLLVVWCWCVCLWLVLVKCLLCVFVVVVLVFLFVVWFFWLLRFVLQDFDVEGVLCVEFGWFESQLFLVEGCNFLLFEFDEFQEVF